jgi:2-polyprenyl-3-methyl-5-hydroxy-6-metoxy-1,4-benzoquinol methylase
LTGRISGEGDTVFIKTKSNVKKVADDTQASNRLWWEQLPMTYSDWDGEDRLPASDAELKQLEDEVLGLSPFLRERFDFSGFENQKILDVGCGTGVFSCRFAKHGANVSSIDLTEAGVSLARRNSKAQGLDVSVQQMDAENMAFESNAFDYVFSWGVLHHTKNMNAALSEVGRVLKPGGKGLMMVYHKNSIVYYLHGLFWLLFKGKIFSGYTLKTVQDFYTDGYYHRYLSERELAARLNSAGLNPRRFHVTQYQKKILPMIPGWLDTFLKNRFGMCLICEFSKLPE